MPPFYFKDGNAALQYVCKFMDCPLHKESLLPAVVLDSRELLGTEAAVQIRDDGNQIAVLEVASNDGGFLVLASSASPRGPKLLPGQLVVWQAGNYAPAVAKMAKDKRFGWVGIILGTLKPEYVNGGWVNDQPFLPTARL